MAYTEFSQFNKKLVVDQGAFIPGEGPTGRPFKYDAAVVSGVTANTEKTVGAGKDFETFHEAMLWAINAQTKGFGHLTLVLDDGVHAPPSLTDDLNYWWYAYYNITGILSIRSASGDKTACRIALPAGDDGGNYPTFISVVSGGWLWLRNVGIVADAAGNLRPDEATLLSAQGAGVIRVTNCDVIGGYPLYAFLLGKIYVESNSGGASDCEVVCGTGGSCIWAATAGEVFIHQSANAVNLKCNSTGGVGVTIEQGGKMQTILGGVTFDASLDTDTTHTLNEIQYDGGVIANGSSALSFKA